MLGSARGAPAVRLAWIQTGGNLSAPEDRMGLTLAVRRGNQSQKPLLISAAENMKPATRGCSRPDFRALTLLPIRSCCFPPSRDDSFQVFYDFIQTIILLICLDMLSLCDYLTFLCLYEKNCFLSGFIAKRESQKMFRLRSLSAFGRTRPFQISPTG